VANTRPNEVVPKSYSYVFSPYREPAARVPPGQRVTVHCDDAFESRIKRADDIPSIALAGAKFLNPQTGPIYVEGAQPGDTLAVQIEDITPTRDFAVSCLIPFFGGLTSTTVTRTLLQPLEEKVWIWKVGHRRKRPPDRGRCANRLRRARQMARGRLWLVSARRLPAADAGRAALCRQHGGHDVLACGVGRKALRHARVGSAARVISRTKGLVLALLAAYWVVVIVIWIAARPVFDQVAGLPRGQVGAESAEVLVLTALLLLLSVGVVRGWRWLFWLILIAFLAGILRVPAAALELAGKIPQQGPAWYVALTAIVGMIQFVVALRMAAGYRRSGVWGE
jgi:hypothetical protein